MPGFGAIGTFAIGTVPEASAVTYTLSGAAGSYVVTGSAASFAVLQVSGATSYAFTGSAATFLGKFSTIVGNLALIGSVATFETSLEGAAGAYLVSGFPTGAILLVTEGGSYAVTGRSADLTTFLGAVGGNLAVTGYPAELTRDFVNWVRRSFEQQKWNDSAITYVVDSVVVAPPSLPLPSQGNPNITVVTN